jgi:hypothetical protein
VVVIFWVNIQKYVIVAATAIGAAGMIVITLMFGYADANNISARAQKGVRL